MCCPNDHKFIHLDTDSFSELNGRYERTYTKTTRLFCEKCGDIKEIVHRWDGMPEAHNKPDWAKTISTHLHSY